jgi:hypothetical protein
MAVWELTSRGGRAKEVIIDGWPHGNIGAHSWRKWGSADGLLDGVCLVLRVFDAQGTVTFVYLPYPCTREGREGEMAKSSPFHWKLLNGSKLYDL